MNILHQIPTETKIKMELKKVLFNVTRDKVDSILQEFTARQIYPEWFLSPFSFLKIAFQPLLQMNRKSRKLKTKIYQEKRMIYSMNSLLSRSSFVPS